MFKKIKKFIWSEKFILLLILLVALVLRLNALDHGPPSPITPDDNEAAHINTALRMFENKNFSVNMATNNYQPLLSYADAVVFAVTFAASLLLGLFHNIGEMRNYFILDRSVLILISRILVAFISAFTVYGMYRVGKRFFNSAVGLISALLLSVEIIHVVISHKTIVWLPMLLFLVLAFEYAGEVFKTGRLRVYLLATLFAILSYASHLVGGIAIVPLLAAHFLRQKKIISKKSILNRKLIFSVLFFILAMYLIFVINPTPLLWELEGQYVAEEHGFGAVFQEYYEPFFYPFKFFFVLHPLLSLLVLLGAIILLIKKQNKKLLLILSLPFFYYLYIGPMTFSYQPRFFIIFVPFFILLSSFGIFGLIELLKVSKKNKKILIVVLALLAVLPSFLIVYSWSTDIRKKSSAEVAQEWVNKNLQPDSKILTNYLSGHLYLEQNKEYISFMKKSFGENILGSRQKYILDLPDTKTPQPAFFPLSVNFVPQEDWGDILKEHNFDYYILVVRTKEQFPYEISSVLEKRELIKSFGGNSEDETGGVWNWYKNSVDKITKFSDYKKNLIQIYKLNEIF